LKQDGLDGLLKFFLETAHYAPWPFDQEQVTDAPLQFLISEIIREKIFMNTHEEVPYNLSVEVLSIKEERGITFIHADILVRDQSHKKILIGSKGNMLKKIGMAARCALESTFHKKFCLYTNVKVGSAKNETSGDKYGT
jgi:GTP-binding protein Era